MAPETFTVPAYMLFGAVRYAKRLDVPTPPLPEVNAGSRENGKTHLTRSCVTVKRYPVTFTNVNVERIHNSNLCRTCDKVRVQVDEITAEWVRGIYDLARQANMLHEEQARLSPPRGPSIGMYLKKVDRLFGFQEFITAALGRLAAIAENTNDPELRDLFQSIVDHANVKDMTKQLIPEAHKSRLINLLVDDAARSRYLRPESAVQGWYAVVGDQFSSRLLLPAELLQPFHSVFGVGAANQVEPSLWRQLTRYVLHKAGTDPDNGQVDLSDMHLANSVELARNYQGPFVLDGGSFRSPHEWVCEEWELARQKVMESLLTHVRNQMARPVAGHQLVAGNFQRWRPLLGVLFNTSEFDSNSNGYWTAVLPVPVAERVAADGGIAVDYPVEVPADSMEVFLSVTASVLDDLTDEALAVARDTAYATIDLVPEPGT